MLLDPIILDNALDSDIIYLATIDFGRSDITINADYNNDFNSDFLISID